MHTGDGDFSVAPMTTDADLVVDREGLNDEPDIVQCLALAGFVNGGQPGHFINTQDVAIDLMMAVTLLQYDVAKDAATRIEQEPRLTRPVAGGEGDVNAALPERFFVLQDELRTRTKQLREAATRRDDQALATAYGRLTATCVECHSAYLHKQ